MKIIIALSLFFAALSSQAEVYYSPQSKGVMKMDAMEIWIDTSTEGEFAQQMMIKVILNNGIDTALFFDVTTGREGRKTPPYRGPVIKTEKSYLAQMNREYYKNVLWLKNDFVIRSVADQKVMTENGMKMKECIDQSVACTGGSVALSADAGQLLFNLVSIAGKENVTVKIGDGIIAPEFALIMQKIETKYPKRN